MARIGDAELPARIHEVAAPLAADLGVELDDVEIKGHQGSRKVVLVAHSDSGPDVETIAELSRRIGGALDDQDLVPGRYLLEVTSPGADRPLRRPRDFERNLGREVRLVHRSREDTQETTGVVVAADDEAIALEVDGSTVRIAAADVDHGKVVLPW